MEQTPQRVDTSHNLIQDRTLRGRAILGGRASCPPTPIGARPTDKDNRAMRRVGGRDALPPKAPAPTQDLPPCSLCVCDPASAAGWEFVRSKSRNALMPRTI